MRAIRQRYGKGFLVYLNSFLIRNFSSLKNNSISISTNISGIPGMLDWEEMVSNIADGALDMSGSRRRRKEKKSTKLRLLRSSWSFDNQ